MTPISISVHLAEYLGKSPWGSKEGAEGFKKLDRVVREKGEVLVELKAMGLQRIDVSCSREAIANLVERYRGAKWFWLSGIGNRGISENIDAAFARKEMAIIERGTEGDYQILGVPLAKHLVETLEVIERKGMVTSKQVCETIPHLGLTACNNRLRDLSEAGMVARLEGSAFGGGREYLYAPVK